MSTAKKLFESRMELLMAANDRDTADKDSIYIDYILELEQEKAKLIDGIEKIKSLCKSKAVNNHLDQIFIISDIILNKHTDKSNAL